jgi:V/A-type H+-transporting ATPase subunit F
VKLCYQLQLAVLKASKQIRRTLNEIGRISNSDDVGLILVSDDFGKQIRYQLTELRSKKPIPLVFELPSPGSTKETVDYRALLKQILGV